MDTVSLPAGDAKPAIHHIASITSSSKPSVIHDYKVLVKGMVGLMLRLSHEGSSPGLIQNLKSAASSLVRLMCNLVAATVHAWPSLLKLCSSPSALCKPACQCCCSQLEQHPHITCSLHTFLLENGILFFVCIQQAPLVQSAKCSCRATLISFFLQVLLFMRTFIYSAHDAARLMKANLEHDHYKAAPASGAYEDPKQLWQGITVGGSLSPPPPPPPPLVFPVTPPYVPSEGSQALLDKQKYCLQSN